METENFYKIQKDLLDFKDKLKGITTNLDNEKDGTMFEDSKQMHDYLLELKSYIFDKPSLKDYYIKKAREFENYKNSKKFNDDIDFLTFYIKKYKNIKDFTFLFNGLEQYNPLYPFNFDVNKSKIILDYSLYSSFINALFKLDNYNNPDELLRLDTVRKNLENLPEYFISEINNYMPSDSRDVDIMLLFYTPFFIQIKMFVRQCISDLYQFAQAKTKEEFYSDNPGRIQIERNIFDLPLREKQIFEELCKNPSIKVNELEKTLHIKASTINTYLNGNDTIPPIMERLTKGLMNENEIKAKGIKALRKFIIDNHLQNDIKDLS